MAVRGERSGLDQDGAAVPVRAIEARQQQMQIHGQRVHRHHLGRQRAAQRCELRLQLLGIADPGPAAVLVPEHRQALPVLDLRLDQGARAARARLPGSGRTDTPAAPIGAPAAGRSGRRRGASGSAASRSRAHASASAPPAVCGSSAMGSRPPAADRAWAGTARRRRRSPGLCSASRYQPSGNASSMKASSVIVHSGRAAWASSVLAGGSPKKMWCAVRCRRHRRGRPTGRRAPDARCRARPARSRPRPTGTARPRPAPRRTCLDRWAACGSPRRAPLSRGAGGAGHARSSAPQVMSRSASWGRGTLPSLLSAASSGSTVSSIESSSRCGISA